ncbi:ATP-binding cassette domain-containing protein [Pseudomonas sp.]|jgi:zinc/manganese transport system ATP-binding protein|uniref:ATP-binding cassette domain-containing protein n=1 Tax=Pseudomonas sp. TaxID=306 RepID=UPI00272B2034|nr:ATP-binding cassette domain-containing protein [Pseudomonas sp.]
MLIDCDQVIAGFAGPQLGPVSLRLSPGERRLVTGPNGSGKSLLLKAILGRARVFSGRIDRAADLAIGHLAQEHGRPAVWPLSGRDWFTAMGIRPPDEPWISGLLEKRLDRLSGGQWQLLRLAAVVRSVAEGGQPRLLLLDEPSNHLDRQVRAQALALLKQVPSDVGVLITSHDHALIEALELSVIALGETGGVES